MQTDEEILKKLTEVLAELFEIDPADVSYEANLYEDLDLDSIDAVDLVIKLKEITGKMANAEEFKSVRTVGDVVKVVRNLLQQ